MFPVFGCWESSSRGWICKDTTSIKPNTPGSWYPPHSSCLLWPLVRPWPRVQVGTLVCRMRVSALRGAICCQTFVSHCGLIILWLSGPVFTPSLLCAGIILGAMTWHQSPGRREGSWSANQRPVLRAHWPIRRQDVLQTDISLVESQHGERTSARQGSLPHSNAWRA